MLYLLDANTLIDAKRDYYPIQRVPEFWDWLIFQGKNGSVEIPLEIYREFSDKVDKEGNMDSLAIWAKREDVRRALLIDENIDKNSIQLVYNQYLLDPTDEDIVEIGNDPFLISYGLFNGNCTIVTTERSKSSIKVGPERRIPDVCKDLRIPCIDTFELIRILDFRTDWTVNLGELMPNKKGPK